MRLLTLLKQFFIDIIIKISFFVKIIHSWLKRNPKNRTYIDGSILILVGINGLLFTNLIFPTIGFTIFENEWVVGVSMIIWGVLIWGIKGIYSVIKCQKIEIPLKYEFILQVLFIPIIIILYKTINYFKTNANEREN